MADDRLGHKGRTPKQVATTQLFARDAALAEIRPTIAKRIETVLHSGRYILGEEAEGFESEFAEYLGREHCIGVANGTDALMIGLLALGVGRGDEVIVPAVTFFATAEAVAAIGAEPVFADVEADTWNISARTVEPLIGERTAALAPVHLFGNPAPMGELLDLAGAAGVPVLEDAAQAAGARLEGRMAGAFGRAATFSFYPGKNLARSGTRGRVLPTIRRSRRSPGVFATTDRRTSGFTPRSGSTPASTRSRQPRCASRFPASTTGPRRAAPPPRPTATRVSASWSTSPGRSPRQSHASTCSSSPRRGEAIFRPACAMRGSRAASITLPPRPSNRDARVPPFAAVAGSGSYADTALAVPMGESLASAEVARAVAAIRDAIG